MVINPKQLHLGSILIDQRGQYCVVETLSPILEDCGIYSYGKAHTYHPFKYVVVTPEMLELIGFKLNNGRYQFRSMFVEFIDGHVNVDMAWIENEHNSMIYFESGSFYLHILQQFYSLHMNGQELDTILLLYQNRK